MSWYGVFDNCTCALGETKFRTIVCLFERAAMVFKSLQGLAPEYLCTKFAHRNSGYCLSHCVNRVNVLQPRTNYKTAIAIGRSFVEQFAHRTKESRVPQ